MVNSIAGVREGGCDTWSRDRKFVRQMEPPHSKKENLRRLVYGATNREGDPEAWSKGLMPEKETLKGGLQGYYQKGRP
jgi:hypothetical protein